jgi:hypothetical protein
MTVTQERESDRGGGRQRSATVTEERESDTGGGGGV